MGLLMNTCCLLALESETSALLSILLHKLFSIYINKPWHDLLLLH